MQLLRTGIKGPERSEGAGNGVGTVLNTTIQTTFPRLVNDVMT